MGNNKTFNIVFCVNNAYVNHLIVTIYSLIKNNAKHRLHIHILSSDISDTSIEAVDSLKSMGAHINISYYSVDPRRFDDMAITMDYITTETYYRLLIADVVGKSIETVLYLDADILVVGDIGKLFSSPFKVSNYAAAVPDIYLDKESSYKRSIGTGDSVYVNAGVMMYNLAAIRRDNLVSTLIDRAINKKNKYQDQDVLNVVFKGKINTLERKYNYQIKDIVYKTIPKEDMVILHYSGSSKPWNRDRSYDAFSTIYDEYKLQASKYIASKSRNIKYGLLKYSTDNVGDSIQGIAARKFLPQVDYYFERDNMDLTKTQPGETVKVIINGWWGDGPENWPPLDQNLDILPVSMYAEDRIQAEFKKPRSIQMLNFFGPVGARSNGTKKFLEANGVKSYFSGCVTLTLNADDNVKKQDYILAVDVPDNVYERMVQETNRRIIRLDVMRAHTTDINEQHRLGELYLYLYQSARTVVTTRLHTMLPCLALQTPVLFINDILDDDDVRFSGLSILAHNLKSKEYVINPKKYDIDRPPANKNDYKKIRRDLEKTCRHFTGYMSKDSYLSCPVDTTIKDLDLLQALLAGSDKLGKLTIKNNQLKTQLEHKQHHVIELAQEIERLKLEIDKMQNSLSWKATRPLREVSYKMRKSKSEK